MNFVRHRVRPAPCRGRDRGRTPVQQTTIGQPLPRETQANPATYEPSQYLIAKVVFFPVDLVKKLLKWIHYGLNRTRLYARPVRSGRKSAERPDSNSNREFTIWLRISCQVLKSPIEHCYSKLPLFSDG